MFDQRLVKDTSIIIAIWLLLIPFCSLIGQETVPFSRLSKLNGLSNNTVNDIKQDTSGYLWIATNKGLNRYDGLEFKTYQSNTSEVLQSDYILCLEIDSKNRLWFGTSDGGLYFLNIFEDKIYAIANDLLEINTILETENGDFWVGAKRGLFLMSQGNQGRFSFKQYSDLNVQAIKGQDGNLWLGTSSGVYKYTNRNSKILPIYKEKLRNEQIFDIEIIGENEIWIATRHLGVVIYQLEEDRLLSINEKMNNLKVLDFKDARTLLKGVKNELYIGTDGAGLFVYDIKAQEIEQYTKSTNNNSILSNTIFSIYEDRDANIWLGHIRKGISVVNNDKDKVDFFFRESLNDDYSAVLSIYEDEDGSFLCGTDGKGVFKINPKTNKNEGLSFSSNLENAYVQSVFRDNENHLWIGTFSKGVFIVSPSLKVEQLSSEANDIRGFCEDGKGNIWIATNGKGLFKFNRNNDSIKQYSNQPLNKHSLSNNNILSISFLNEKIYMATDGGGLNILNTKTEEIQNFSYSPGGNSILGNKLICLYVENDDNIWVGSTLGITNIIQKNGEKQFIQYSFDDLSFGRFILGILVDDNQQVWISTDEGLYKLEKETGRFSKVNLGATFNSTEFHYNACYKALDGKLFFGSINGIFSFYPDQMFQTERSNEVNITGFKVYGKDEKLQNERNVENLHQIETDKRVVVDAKTSLVQIDFANIRLPSSNESQYAVQLVNYDEDWQYLGKVRTVSYDNLPSGNYTFKVKCIDTFNQHSNKVTRFDILILTPLWKSWWAVFIYVLLIGTMIYLVHRYFNQWRNLKKNLRFEKLTREREEELRKMQVTFFTNISHDLRTPLTLIMGNIKRLIKNEQSNVSQQREVIVIENNINRLLTLSNELLDLRKIENGDFKLNLIRGNITVLLKEAFYAFYDHAAERGIQYEWQEIDQEICIAFDYDQLEKVFFNLLSNAFKFTSSKGNIKLVVNNSDQDILQISIINSGQTLSKQQQENMFNRFYQSTENLEDEAIGPGVGIGLSIVKDIIDLHKGNIEVESKDGEISFTVSLNKKNNEKSLLDNKTKMLPLEKIENYINQEKFIAQSLSIKEQNEFKDSLIIVAEDNFDLRKFLVSSLEENYRVLEAENGKQAMDLVLQNLPDLIVSDVMMPEMDGITLCFKLKTNVKTSHIPIVLLTARKSRYYKTKGLETGADDYINKPFYEDELKIRIRNLLKIRKDLRDKFTLDAIMKPEEVELNARDQEFIQNLCQVIEKNIDNTSLKAETISKHLNMSHSLVYKKLKALTGYSIVEFIRDYRLQKAEMLLVQNQLSISEICYRVGFGDRRYFSTSFKKKYKMSPTEYLKIKKAAE